MMMYILDAINSGEKKATRIMLHANLSWNQLKKTLESLIDEGYVTSVDVSDLKRGQDKRSSTFYEITSNGRFMLKFLRTANKLFAYEATEHSTITRA
jgi:predicted transcriptional regulator